MSVDSTPVPFFRRLELWIAILAILIPALIGWIYRVQAATDSHTAAITRIERRVDEHEQVNRQSSDRLARIETKIDILLEKKAK
jgi:hypothetical protein